MHQKFHQCEPAVKVSSALVKSRLFSRRQDLLNPNFLLTRYSSLDFKGDTICPANDSVGQIVISSLCNREFDKRFSDFVVDLLSVINGINRTLMNILQFALEALSLTAAQPAF